MYKYANIGNWPIRAKKNATDEWSFVQPWESFDTELSPRFFTSTDVVVVSDRTEQDLKARAESFSQYVENAVHAEKERLKEVKEEYEKKVEDVKEISKKQKENAEVLHEREKTRFDLYKKATEEKKKATKEKKEEKKVETKK